MRGNPNELHFNSKKNNILMLREIKVRRVYQWICVDLTSITAKGEYGPQGTVLLSGSTAKT